MTFFQFEADFVDSLNCIPMQVRYKLDTCGVKLKLAHWHKFPQEIRSQLCDRPCSTSAEIKDYYDWLHQQVISHTGSEAKDLPIEENPPWLDDTIVPEMVQAKAQAFNLTITLEQWANLTHLQRFALIKLSRSSHENANFIPAMKEFNLA
jgi:hypothetical protein